MPRPKLREKRRRDLTKMHERALLRGPRYFDPWPDPWHYNNSPADTESILGDMGQAWTTLRDDLLAEWIDERPGSRPWAWWQFDSPEPRRLLSGPGASVLADPDALPWATRLEFGKPVCFRTEREMLSVWESERDYLERLGLMTDAEVVSFIGE